MPTLSGKVALVTGGSRGIGAATVRQLTTEGAQVAFSYVRSKEAATALEVAVKEAGGVAVAFQADAAERGAHDKLIQAVHQRFGQLDILVNNAGVFEVGPVEAVSDEIFDKTLAVNVRGVFEATRAAVPLMESGGRIINIGSIVGDQTPAPGLSVYSLSKGAVAAFTRGLARDLGARGITANVVQPGPIDTDMNPADGADSAGFAAFTATGKFGEPGDVANLVAFLASPQAGNITGASLNVDGGFNA